MIDIGWPGATTRLVPELADLGYHRYWTTEHRSPGQSASPLVQAAVALASTPDASLGVGTAGVMLAHRSPREVADEAALLDLHFPGRFALGVVAGLGGSVEVARELLDGRPGWSTETHARKVVGLAALCDELRHAAAPDGDAVGPRSGRAVPLWVCGTSERSARLAGEVGAGLALHLSLSADPDDARRAVGAYRDSFVPPADAGGRAPATMAACFVRIRCGAAGARVGDTQPRTWEGSAAAVVDALAVLADDLALDEVAVAAVDGTVDDQLVAYATVAAAADVSGW